MEDEKNTQEQSENRKSRTEHLAPWQYKKGQTGNPNGRPKGPSLKEWAKNKLITMTDEEREEFFHGLPKETIWKMTEGNPKNDVEVSGNLNISTILNDLEDDGQKASN